MRELTGMDIPYDGTGVCLRLFSNAQDVVVTILDQIFEVSSNISVVKGVRSRLLPSS